MSRISEPSGIAKGESDYGPAKGMFYSNKMKHLCHGDYVRNNALRFESPEMAPSASKPRLNLISNKKASCFLYAAVHSRQVTWGQLYNSTHSLHA